MTSKEEQLVGITEEQLEKAARKLCELRGIDPDKRVSHGAPPNSMGYVPAVLMYSPAWSLVASEIRGFWMMIQAIEFATTEVAIHK